MVYSKTLIKFTLTILLLNTLFFTSGTHAQKVLTLVEAQKIAESQSPDIRSLELSVKRMRERLLAKKASLKTHFNLSLTPFSYNQGRTFNNLVNVWNTTEEKSSSGNFIVSQPIPWTDGTLFFRNEFSWQESYSEYTNMQNKSFKNNMYFSLHQPFFTYNRTKMELNELRLDLENTTLNYIINKLAMERIVAQAFYRVYQAKMSLQVAKDEYENYKSSYEIKKNKVSAGIAAEEDLYQAEHDLANSEAGVYSAEVELDNAKDDLKRMIGISLDENIYVTADVAYEPVIVDLSMAINHGLKNRMELRQKKISLIEAQQNLIKTKAQNEFKGSVDLSFGLIGTNEMFNSIYDAPTDNKGVTVSLNIPLWDWGEKEHNINASEAAIESEELSFDDQQKTIIISIRKVYRNLKNLKNQINSAEKQIKNAQLTYDINLERYKSGDLTGMQLSQYQTQLSQAKQSHVNALINYKLELLKLKIETLYDFKKGVPVIPEIDNIED